MLFTCSAGVTFEDPVNEIKNGWSCNKLLLLLNGWINNLTIKWFILIKIIYHLENKSINYINRLISIN